MRIIAPRISGTPGESFSHPTAPWRICKNWLSRPPSCRGDPPVSRPRVRLASAPVKSSGKVLVAGASGLREACSVARGVSRSPEFIGSFFFF